MATTKEQILDSLKELNKRVQSLEARADDEDCYKDKKAIRDDVKSLREQVVSLEKLLTEEGVEDGNGKDSDDEWF